MPLPGRYGPPPVPPPLPGPMPEPPFADPCPARPDPPPSPGPRLSDASASAIEHAGAIAGSAGALDRPARPPAAPVRLRRGGGGSTGRSAGSHRRRTAGRGGGSDPAVGRRARPDRALRSDSSLHRGWRRRRRLLEPAATAAAARSRATRNTSRTGSIFGAAAARSALAVPASPAGRVRQHRARGAAPDVASGTPGVPGDAGAARNSCAEPARPACDPRSCSTACTASSQPTNRPSSVEIAPTRSAPRRRARRAPAAPRDLARGEDVRAGAAVVWTWHARAAKCRRRLAHFGQDASRRDRLSDEAGQNTCRPRLRARSCFSAVSRSQPSGRVCTILDTRGGRSRPRRTPPLRFDPTSVLQPQHGSAGDRDGGVERHRAGDGAEVCARQARRCWPSAGTTRRCAEVAAEVSERGRPRRAVVAADVTAADAPDAIVAAAVEALRRHRRRWSMPPASSAPGSVEIDRRRAVGRMMDINLRAPFRLMRAATPALIAVARTRS